MRATESVKFTNVDATPADFPLTGGKYAIDVVATWGGGNIVLQVALPGGTYAPVHTALTDDGHVVVDLAPGLYQFTLTTATAAFAAITRIPQE